MHRNRILSGILATLAIVAKAQDIVAPDVTELTNATLKDFALFNDLILVNFYAPWCQYCKALAPEYEAAAAALKEKNIQLAKVDCNKEEGLCKDYGIRSYPDLQILQGPKNSTPYTGSRNSEGIVSFMIRQSLPVVSSLVADNITEFKSSDDNVLIAYVAADDTASKVAFRSAAAELRHRFRCGLQVIDDLDSSKANQLTLPSVVLYQHNGEGDEAVLTQPIESERIKQFASNAIVPLVGEINSDTIALYRESGLPIGWIFGETAEERWRLAELLRPVAETHKEQLHLGIIDAIEYRDSASDLNMQKDKFPAFAILDLETNKKYPFDQSKEITRESIADFVRDFTSGGLAPSITSDPIPETQDGPVTVVVGHSFQEVVVNNEKDVLVMIYAPWCGHSKRLAPNYDILGSEYAASNFSDNITIAKIDGTTNDVPDAIPKGYPMLMFYPASSKNAPVRYEGDRSIDDLVTFISKNGNYGALISIEEKANDAEISLAGVEIAHEHDEL